MRRKQLLWRSLFNHNLFSMKFVFYGLMIPLAYFAGKFLYEPLLGGTPDAVAVSDGVVEVKVHSEMGLITEVIDFSNVELTDYPEKVILSQSVVLTDSEGLNPLKLEPGSPVKPLSLAEQMLTVTSPLAPQLTGEVPVKETTFATGVANKRMDKRMAMLGKGKKKGKNKGKKQAAPVSPTATTEEIMPPKEMTDEEMASNENEAMPPKPEMTEENTGKAPAGEAASGSLTAEQLVASMKESLAAGTIKELDAAKVNNWEAAPNETFDGQEFQVGIATYKEMTILGEKELKAKALFKDGKLDKWIHSKTGMQIR